MSVYRNYEAWPSEDEEFTQQLADAMKGYAGSNWNPRRVHFDKEGFCVIGLHRMHYAVRVPSLTLVQRELKRGTHADIAARAGSHTHTPLMEVNVLGDEAEAVMRCLLEARADANKSSLGGEPPLFHYAQEPIEFIRLLLAFKADPLVKCGHTGKSMLDRMRRFRPHVAEAIDEFLAIPTQPPLAPPPPIPLFLASPRLDRPRRCPWRAAWWLFLFVGCFAMWMLC